MKNGTSRIPGQLRDNNGNIFSEPQDIVDAFATTIANVFTVNNSTHIESTSISSNSFSMSSVSIEDLILIMSNLSNKQTCGDDLVPSFLIRDCRYALVHHN